MSIFEQPASDFDVDFSFAMAFYRPVRLKGWKGLQQSAQLARATLHKVHWHDLTAKQSMAKDTHGIIICGARGALLDGQVWEPSARSILIACHYGLAFVEVSIALRRMTATELMKSWAGQQDMQEALKMHAMASAETMVTEFQRRKASGLPVPSAAAITQVLDEAGSDISPHLRATVPMLMSETKIGDLPWKPRAVHPKPE